MDWTAAIENNHAALKRILVMLVALVESAGGGDGDGRAATLPRRLHRFVLRLLRPAEAAARRLIVLAARGLVVELSPSSRGKLRPGSLSIFVRAGVGTGIVLPTGPKPDWACSPPRPPRRSFPLADALCRWDRPSRPKQAGVPRIGFLDRPRPDDTLPHSPDLLDSGALQLRLDLLGRALADLPGEARRFARWRARRDAGLIRRVSPLRPGPPPGRRRRSSHEVFEVLDNLHGLAFWALEPADTS